MFSVFNRTVDMASAPEMKMANKMTVLAAASLSTLLFSLCYYFVREVAVANVLLVPIVIVAARFGLKPGLFFSVLMGFVATCMIVASGASAFVNHPLSTVVTDLSFLFFGSAVGFTSDLSRRLNIELTTKKKLLEENIMIRQRLEEHLAERTKERDAAVRHLEHVSQLEEVGRLAGGVAHDFNNQLTGVIGYCDVLLDMITEEKARLFIGRIRSSGKRASDVTRQLLDFARKGPHHTTTVNIHEILDEALSVLSVSSTNKNISVSRHLHAETPLVDGDTSRLQNVFLNILLNARDAISGEGSITVRSGIVRLSDEDPVRREFELTEPEYLLVTIGDTGSGIPPEILNRIFEPFFTTKESNGGSGMGLAAVYGIIRKHKGGLSVQSRSGRGTTLSVYLPLAQVCAATQEFVVESKKIMHTEGAHILVVDDEDIVAEVLMETLKNCGYRISVHNNPVKAIEFYKENYKTIDLALIDMIMPGKNGLETFSDMKNINPDIKAIMLSGYAMNSDLKEASCRGVMNFLQKPYESRELVATIESAIRFGADSLTETPIASEGES